MSPLPGVFGSRVKKTVGELIGSSLAYRHLICQVYSGYILEHDKNATGIVESCPFQLSVSDIRLYSRF